MSATNPIFRAPKTRRLVSAWMVQEAAAHAVAQVRALAGSFDQVILMCGGVHGDASLPDHWTAEERTRLVATFRELQVSVLNDFAGGWEGAFQEVVKSPELVRRLIENMVDDCEDTGADGVDIDLEHLPAIARVPFTDFFAGLSGALHARGKMLSIATGATLSAYRRDWGLGFLDVPALAPYADHVRPMNYDLFYPAPESSPGPTSTAPWTRERMAYMANEVPKHKIVAGLPTYSVDWDIDRPERSRQIYDYQWIEARKQEAPHGYQWISYLDVGYLRYRDADGGTHLLYISDAKSTKSHLVTVDDLDLAGVCFWCLIGEDPALWQAVQEHLRRY